MIQISNSSNIKAVGYNPMKNDMTVEFKSGKTYRYSPCHEEMWNELSEVIQSGKSVGEWVNKNLVRNEKLKVARI
jgi:hypothetical protein